VSHAFRLSSNHFIVNVLLNVEVYLKISPLIHKVIIMLLGGLLIFITINAHESDNKTRKTGISEMANTSI